jgi:hypothetical protein
MTFLNLGFGAINAWALWQPKINDIFPWMNLGVFFFLLLIAALALGIIHYVFVQKPTISFQNAQACKHDNPVMKQLEEIKRNLKKHMGDEYEDTPSN